MTVNGIKITQETTMATRKYFQDIDRACIADAISGKTRVNDLQSYIKWREKGIADSVSGKGDRTLTFLQAALWIQTGECVPILSR